MDSTLRHYSVLFLLCVGTSPTVVQGEFQLLSTTDVPWRSYFSLSFSDCSPAAIARRFPELFSGVDQEFPENFTVAYNEREALELGGRRNYFYPGINIELYTKSPISDIARGFKLLLRKNSRTLCVIITIPANQIVERVEQELFPLTGTTHYRVSVASLSTLPGDDDHADDITGHQVYNVVTGKFGIYRPGGRLPAPADWIATISYEVKLYENGTGRMLDVAFSRPPPVYNFRRFQVALVPEEDYIDTQIGVTTTFGYVFTGITAGHYRISVKPLDDFFSVAGQCLCFHANQLCTNCLTTETEIFTVHVQ